MISHNEAVRRLKGRLKDPRWPFLAQSSEAIDALEEQPAPLTRRQLVNITNNVDNSTTPADLARLLEEHAGIYTDDDFDPSEWDED